MKITFEQLEDWLGSSNTEYEAIKTLLDIANGEYKVSQLTEDIKEYGTI